MTIFKTFKDFLNTGSIEDLQKRCAPFLEQSNGAPLYRGYKISMRGRIGAPTEVAISKDRKPRDSTNYVHELMNVYFEKKFGERIRSSGLFTTGDLKLAKFYGTPHYVLPVGNFKFFWAELGGKPVCDTLRFSRAIEDLMRVRREDEKHIVTAQVLDQVTWHTTDLQRAIESSAEIAILADTSILIPVGKTPYEKLIGR